MGDVVAEARAASRADAWRHIEPLTAEVARLQSVVAGVEAVADHLDREAVMAEQDAKSRRFRGQNVVFQAEAIARRDAARRLRSVLSDTKGGHADE